MEFKSKRPTKWNIFENTCHRIVSLDYMRLNQCFSSLKTKVMQLTLTMRKQKDWKRDLERKVELTKIKNFGDIRFYRRVYQNEICLLRLSLYWTLSRSWFIKIWFRLLKKVFLNHLLRETKFPRIHQASTKWS